MPLVFLATTNPYSATVLVVRTQNFKVEIALIFELRVLCLEGHPVK
jgi:hypothetical protein